MSTWTTVRRKVKNVQATSMNLNCDKITGVVRSVRVENVEDPMMRDIQYLDKLVDEPVI